MPPGSWPGERRRSRSCLLYHENLVGRTLEALRPVPQSGSFLVPELPQVVVHSAAAGRIPAADSCCRPSPW